MISVEEIMTPDPIRLGSDNTLGDAHQVMTEKHIHHIPIVDSNDKLLGLISHRDILAASGSVLRENPSDQTNRKLSELMITDVVSTTPTADTLKAAQYIHDSRHGCLPIIDQDKVVGIVTEYDFVEVAINLLERRLDQDPDSDDSDFLNEESAGDDFGVDTTDSKDWD